MLMAELDALGPDVLVLSTGLDRITRSQAQYERLFKHAATGGHAAVAFLWDRHTKLRANVALLLRSQVVFPQVMQWQDDLDKQFRAPMSDLAVPAVQPVMWLTSPRDANAQTTIAPHTVRHLENAEQWVQSGLLTAYQGDSGPVPEVFKKDEGARGFSAERMTAWESHIAE